MTTKGVIENLVINHILVNFELTKKRKGWREPSVYLWGNYNNYSRIFFELNPSCSFLHPYYDFSKQVGWAAYALAYICCRQPQVLVH